MNSILISSSYFSFIFFLFQNCAILQFDIKEQGSQEKFIPEKKTEGLSKFELFNWTSRDNDELSRNLIRGIKEFSNVEIEQGVGGEKYIQIILDRSPGVNLISSNVINHPGEVILRILNRIITVATLTLVPFRIHNRRLVKVNFIESGRITKERSYSSNYDVFIGIGALLLYPWSDKNFIKNDMNRIGKEIGKEI
jgi:hypothetical protein